MPKKSRPKKSRLVLAQSDKENPNDTKETILRFASQILLPISVGQDYHEAIKLETLLILIKKSFKETPIPLVRIMVADTLQRYSLAIQLGKTPEACEVLAREKGEEWKERYLLAIKSVLGETVQLEIWDVWRHHALFTPFINLIENYYAENRLFREALERDIHDFEERHHKSSHPNGLTAVEKEHCRAYIKEECAILIIWEYAQVSPGYRVMIYPMKLSHAMTVIKSHWTQFKSFSAELHSFSEKASAFFTPIEGVSQAKNEEVDSQKPPILKTLP
jgi:hypothetical protein